MIKYQWFSKILLKWNQVHNTRIMPWKGIKDPYKIWLSEIILQQTRVEQGQDYYLKLTKLYPRIEDLADASQQELYSQWQGLGYYNRCRNMHETAKFIVNEYKGKFPQDYPTIRSLKGVGDYTAAAIASFAYNLPYAVVDGNVVRVLSRIFGSKANFYTAAGKFYFQQLAQNLLDTLNPGRYNQAMMDFGAMLCTPKSPSCPSCPFRTRCIAFAENAIEQYPAKKIKKPLRIRHFHFWLCIKDREISIVKREHKDIWHNLHTLPFIETEDAILPRTSLKLKPSKPLMIIEQVLSHQKIIGIFYDSKLTPLPKNLQNVFEVPLSDLKQYGFPKLIISFFEKNNYL